MQAIIREVNNIEYIHSINMQLYRIQQFDDLEWPVEFHGFY